MKKINSESLNFVVNKDEYLYVFELKGKNIKLKKIHVGDKKDKIEIIKLSHEEVSFIRIVNGKINNIYSDIEKDNLTNDIIKNLNTNLVTEAIDLDYISNSIKKHYINNVIDNGIIALSLNNDKLNIVLLSTNSIIGEIVRDYDVKVKVDKNYLIDTLNLLSEYVLFNKTKVLKKELVN